MIVADKLTVGHGSAHPPVLRDLSLRASAGEMVCVLGPNGAGKSTLLRTLAGLLPARSGIVSLAGRSLSEMTPRARARRLGVVLPESLPSAMLRVDELVALGRHPHTGWRGTLGAADRAAVVRAMRQIGIEPLAKRRLGALSDGERQKVMIARALAQEPGMLILDEPTAFLDLAARAEMLALLRRLAHGGHDEGADGNPPRGVLLSTHDLDLALRHADRVWLIDSGCVVVGVPEDLVLDGAINAAFGRPGLRFDRTTGAFRVDQSGHLPAVFVDGEGDEAMWTRRALVRRGWRVLEGDEGEAYATVRVVVTEDGEGASSASWVLERDEQASRHGSIGELLEVLDSTKDGAVPR